MSATGRSPRIPLSPSSPPETGLKRRRLSDKTSNTSSPPYMSVATKSYVSSYGHTSHPDDTKSRSPPRSPSSPSSYTPRTTQRESQTYSTPASSLNMMEDSDRHRDKRQRIEQESAADDSMEVDNSAQSTNHDRNDIVKKEEGLIPKVIVEDLSNNTDDSALDQLQKDMGDAFLLGRSKLNPRGPNPEFHLLGVYGLVPLLKTVARNDPITQEKINKLRKSYDGQIKSFGLSGRNKSIKIDRLETDASQLRQSIGSGLKDFPDDTNSAQKPYQSDAEWDAEHATVKIQVNPDFRAKLRKAMELQPGRVRDVEKWDEVLGHDKARPNGPTPLPVQPQVPQRAPNGVMRQPPQTVPDFKRQTRGKKRSYGDDSFTGYGDGFSDVEDAGAVDDYGDDEGGIRRKRRKESTGGPLTYGQQMGR